MGGRKRALITAMTALFAIGAYAATFWTLVDEDENIAMSIDVQSMVTSPESVIVDVLIVYKHTQQYEQPDGTSIPYVAAVGPFYFGCTANKFGVANRTTLYRSADTSQAPIGTFLDKSFTGKFYMLDAPPGPTLQKIAKLVC